MTAYVRKILDVRQSTYGGFGRNASFTQDVMSRLATRHMGDSAFDDMVIRETMHMVIHKFARLHCGGLTPQNFDSLVDTGGYAKAGAEALAVGELVLSTLPPGHIETDRRLRMMYNTVIAYFKDMEDMSTAQITERLASLADYLSGMAMQLQPEMEESE